MRLNLSFAAASRSEEAGGFSGAWFQDILTGRPVGITALQKETERVTEGDFRTQHRGSNTLNEGVKRERVTPSGKTVFTHELWIILGESGWDSALCVITQLYFLRCSTEQENVCFKDILRTANSV